MVSGCRTPAPCLGCEPATHPHVQKEVRRSATVVGGPCGTECWTDGLQGAIKGR